MVLTLPESISATRRSISALHAASTSGSGCASRDSIGGLSQRRPIVFGELRRVTKQRCDVLGHVPFYPRRVNVRGHVCVSISARAASTSRWPGQPCGLGSIEPSTGLGTDVVPDVELVPGTSRAFFVPGGANALRSVTAGKTRLATPTVYYPVISVSVPGTTLGFWGTVLVCRLLSSTTTWSSR